MAVDANPTAAPPVPGPVATPVVATDWGSLVAVISNSAIALVQHLGLATVLLLGVLWFGARPIVSAHTENIETQTKVLRESGETLRELLAASRQQSQQHERQIELLTAIKIDKHGS